MELTGVIIWIIQGLLADLLSLPDPLSNLGLQELQISSASWTIEPRKIQFYL